MSGILLPLETYTLKRALFWGNCVDHLKQVFTGKLGTRMVHLIVAGVELFPLTGQVISLFETFIATIAIEIRFRHKQSLIKELRSFYGRGKETLPKEAEIFKLKIDEYEKTGKYEKEEEYHYKDVACKQFETFRDQLYQHRLDFIKKEKEVIKLLGSNSEETKVLTLKIEELRNLGKPESETVVRKLRNEYLQLKVTILPKLIEKWLTFDPKSLQKFSGSLLFDKLYLNEKYFGGSNLETIPYLTTAFERLAQNCVEWGIEREVSQFIVEFKNYFTKLYQNQNLYQLRFKYRTAAQFILDDKREEFKKLHDTAIFESLKKMKIGDSLLIPFGITGHATELLVERKEKAFKLTHYNTGGGVDDNHYQNQDRMQTHDIIDEIPEKVILDEAIWVKGFSSCVISEDINLPYVWLKEFTNQGGVRQPASNHKEEYEQAQESGSCAVQCRMALIRHQIMHQFPGSIVEKKACYKVIKTYLFLQFLKDNESQLRPSIKQLLPTVKEKLEGERALIEIAKDPQKMEESLKVFKDLLESVQEKTDITLLQEPSSFLKRYAQLKKISFKIFKKITNHDHPICIELTKAPCLNLLAAKLKHLILVKDNLRAKLLKELKEGMGSYCIEILGIFHISKYKKFIIDEIMKGWKDANQKNYEPQKIKSFFRVMKSAHVVDQCKKTASDIVSRIFEKLEKEGEVDLRKSLIEDWNKEGNAFKETSELKK